MTSLDKTVLYDIARIREDFPILAHEHHAGVPLVYLDNAASSQKPRVVIDAIRDYYERYNANVHRGIHKLSETATEAYEGARIKIKHLINAESKREIIYTRGTTESLNLVVHTWGAANLKAGDVVVTTQIEHHANIVPWQILAARLGFTIKYVPIHEDGTLDLDVYRAFLAQGNVKIVSVVHVSNVLGTVNPVAEMARLAHEAGALIMVDGAQSAPHMPVDVRALDCDFFAFSSHKMCGPTGIGVLYGKRHLLEEMPPWMGGGDMISTVSYENCTWNELPYKFEAGTPSIAEAIGLGVAVDYLSAIGLERIHAHTQQLTEYALERLRALDGVTVYGAAADRGAVAAFTVEGIHAHDLAQMLDTDGVAVRAGHHCAMPLHTLLNLNATARASFYLYNTTEEVDRLIAAVERAKRTFKRV